MQVLLLLCTSDMHATHGAGFSWHAVDRRVALLRRILVVEGHAGRAGGSCLPRAEEPGGISAFAAAQVATYYCPFVTPLVPVCALRRCCSWHV
jgi:hypothetical protein